MKDGMLEFSDWPMFDLLMTDKELCREVIEIILDESIADIEYIVTEDDVRPTLTNHGVRLDAFVKTKNEIYDIEMQTTKREDLGRRMRYYQGALDTLTLRKGEGYEELPPCIIIFICMHDPFDEGLPVYTLDVNCLEKPSARIGHGFLESPIRSCLGQAPRGALAEPATLCLDGGSRGRSAYGPACRCGEKGQQKRELAEGEDGVADV